MHHHFPGNLKSCKICILVGSTTIFQIFSGQVWPLQEAGSHLGRVGRALQGRRHRRHRQDRYDRQRACHCLGTIYVNLSFDEHHVLTMLQHADAVWAGARLPHNQVVQGGQHRRRLLRRKVTTLQKELLFLQNKSNLFVKKINAPSRYLYVCDVPHSEFEELKSQDTGGLHQVFAAIWGGRGWGGGETFGRWRESEEDWALIVENGFRLNKPTPSPSSVDQTDIIPLSSVHVH